MSQAKDAPFGDANSIVLFDQETMSGITPGVRTRIFQRVRLRAVGAQAGGDDRTDGGTAWARLLWHVEDSDAEGETASEDLPAKTIEGALCTVHLREDEGDSWSIEPLLTLANVSADGFPAALSDALFATGWRLQTCGSCRWWQPGPVRQVDGLPVGHCRLVGDSPIAGGTPEALAIQSMLALDCTDWAAAAGNEWPAADSSAVENAGSVPPALPKHAESAAAGGFLSRLGARLGVRSERDPQPASNSQSWQEKLVERSGVGAGTEPCFACQGRIANLGSLTVATPEGDKQTYSVWRCRTCYGAYLNSWIDRWERLDNLETDERVYRVAPVKACTFLAVIDGVVGGDHPAGREHRDEQRRWFEAQIKVLDPLSHQIKHGR